MNDPLATVLRRRARTTDLWIPVDGASMLPAIAPRSEVLVRPASRPAPGQIWAFVARDGSIVVHRCVRRFGDGWHGFRGDSAGVDDLPVGPDRLIGRVVAIRDHGGERAARSALGPVLAANLRRLRRFTRREPPE